MKHTIPLYEEITNSTFHRVLADIISAGKRPILLSINSPGGSVTAGSAIMASLRAHKPGVSVEILGLAASMASAISTVGQPVAMAENAIFMLHLPSSSSSGTADQLRKDADVLDKFRDSLVGAYAQKSGKPAAEIVAMLTVETWLTAQEAKDMGFVDILTGENPAQACAWSSKYPRLAAIGAASKMSPLGDKSLVGQLAAITDPRAKDLFFRRNRIAMIREGARAATPQQPVPMTACDRMAAIREPHDRAKFYKSNRSLLLRQASQAATPGCIHSI